MVDLDWIRIRIGLDSDWIQAAFRRQMCTVLVQGIYGGADECVDGHSMNKIADMGGHSCSSAR